MSPRLSMCSLPVDYFNGDFNKSGYFGRFGGAFLPPELLSEFGRIAEFYERIRSSGEFVNELRHIRKYFQGRPTPVSFCRNLTNKYGGAQIYLKREDLNHMGAHKLNHTMAEGLIAKMMNKKTLIAETGAGQHGVALATAAAYFGLQCEIHMGEVDIEKEAPNVTRMKLLGAKVVPVSFGQRTLKEAVDSAFKSYMENPQDMFFGIGSVVGPHPYPTMVRDFQSIVGQEARKQFLEMNNKLPNNLVACVGGGSNAIGLFSGFLNDANVKIYGVEPFGKGLKLGEHAATMTYGKEAVIHGMNTLCLLNDQNEPANVHSVASGLDYPGVGPEHAHLKDVGRVQYEGVSDQECIDAFFELSKTEGIIPALESAHAIAFATKLAAKQPKDQTILVNLSGRGDKDIEFVSSKFAVSN